MEYKYDKNGNRTEEKYIYEGKLKQTSKFKYDKDGNLTEFYLYDEYGKLNQTSKFKYDKDGNLTEENSYDKDGKLDLDEIKKYKYEKFDKKKNWIVEIVIKSDGVYINEREIIYY